tara:strand:+ start:111 stop:422 length:312 start_codon:yes stop_codon:yes gene_type:complete
MAVEVKDRRTSPFGLVYRSHIDTDAFRALPPCARIVYFVLTTYAGNAGRAWPKQSTLSAVSGYSPRAIRRAIAELDGAGFLLVDVRDPLSWRRTNVYTLIDPT